MQMAKLLFLSALAVLAAAKDTCTGTGPSATAPSNPAITSAANFNLVVNVTANDLTPSIQGWNVSGYHVAACTEFAILDPDYGRPFYVNVTSTTGYKQHSQILSDGGTPIMPYGFFVPSPKETDTEGRRPVEITCSQEATTGVGITQFPKGPRLTYREHPKSKKHTMGAWYACNTDLHTGFAVVLYYRSHGTQTPDNCASIDLYPVCRAETFSAVGAGAKKGKCYLE